MLELAGAGHPVPDGLPALLVALPDDLLEILVNRDVAFLGRDGEDGQAVLA
jgi:hypothetical protein